MVKVDIYDIKGQKIKEEELNAAVFDVEVKPHLLNEIVLWQRDKARQGSQSTLTKGEVSGSVKKPFAQKGRGMARQGTLKNPHQRGGGVTFAPKPRSYAYSMPKSKRRAGLACALSARLKEGRIRLVDKLGIENPKTKEVSEMLNNFGLKSALLVDGQNLNLSLSARNLKNAKYIEQKAINVMDILRYPYLLMTVDAVRKIEHKLLDTAVE